SKRMIVYDDVAPLEKIRVFDARVERPPHYDTFAEFHYAYHYGDVYAPYIKQEEPLKTECQHFLDCIRDGKTPLTSGDQGLQLVRILEASSLSLKHNGSPIRLTETSTVQAPAAHPGVNGNGQNNGRPRVNRSSREKSRSTGNGPSNGKVPLPPLPGPVQPAVMSV